MPRRDVSAVVLEEANGLRWLIRSDGSNHEWVDLFTVKLEAEIRFYDDDKVEIITQVWVLVGVLDAT